MTNQPAMTNLIGNDGCWEYWQHGENVYRVALANKADYLSDHGMPGNVRWECSVRHWEAFGGLAGRQVAA